MDGSKVKALSLNVSVLNNPLKRRHIHNMFRRELIDILFTRDKPIQNERKISETSI